MNSRERVEISLDHQEPDRVPIDFGGTLVTSMNVSIIYELRQKLGLDSPQKPIKIIEPFQMLGEIAPDLIEALGIDCVGVNGSKNIFGFSNNNWKPWDGYHDIPTLIPEKFNIQLNKDGSIFQYPEGDKSLKPSGIMPKGGYYFDVIVRQPEINEEELKPADNLEEFGFISDNEIDFFKKQIDKLYSETDKAIIANFGGASLGDIALIPAPHLKNPKGIRDVTEWYISLIKRKDYIKEVFKRQTDIALSNYEKIYNEVGNKIIAIYISGTDFGTQRCPLISTKTYSEIFKPYHSKINSWVHKNTKWKTFIHTCGANEPLIDGFIESGFDILNPVQCSAQGMDPEKLKKKYGENIVFWGGGVDTQKTLPFGKTNDVINEVRKRIKYLSPGGGFIFNAIHNIQANTPIDNVLALFEAIRKYGEYTIN
ncbi:MAG: uroporphyrinogen decarboxylase family protein [Candidatus Humimicrobiaceae bacterium]